MQWVNQIVYSNAYRLNYVICSNIVNALNMLLIFLVYLLNYETENTESFVNPL